VHRRSSPHLLRNTIRRRALLRPSSPDPNPNHHLKPLIITHSQRYNPELQRRSLERRKEKQEDFDGFVGRLKEYSKSDKPSTSPLRPSFAKVCTNTCHSLDSMGARRRQAATGTGTGPDRRQACRRRRGGGETAGDQGFHQVSLSRPRSIEIV